MECMGGGRESYGNRIGSRGYGKKFILYRYPSSKNASMQSLLELKGRDLSLTLHPCTSHTSGTEKDRGVEARIPVLPLLDSAVKHSLTSARPGFYARFTNKEFIKLQNRSPNYLSRKSKSLMRYIPPSLLFL